MSGKDNPEIDTMRLAYAGQLLPDALVELFRDPTRAFATRIVRRGGEVSCDPGGSSSASRSENPG